MYCCQTPVHLAAGCDQLRCLQLLLDYGGRHDSEDNEKSTPLDYAQKEGNILCGSLLAKHSSKRPHFPTKMDVCPDFGQTNYPNNKCCLKHS